MSAIPPAPQDVDAPAGEGVSQRSIGRMPPHSLEAEVSVLGAAILSRHALATVTEELTPEDFYRTAHGTVFDAIRSLAATGSAVDTVTVIEWLRSRHRLDEVGGATAVVDLVAAAPTAANAKYYADIVRDKALLRSLIEAGTTVVQMGFEDTEDAVATVDRAEAEIFRVSERGVRSEYSSLKEMLPEAFERLEKLAQDNSEVTGLATGFDDLDRLTAGLQPENLVILAARPAMGKSSMSLNIAQYVTVALGRPAIIFSLEMSKIEIVNRMLSSEAGIDSSRMKTGRFDDHDWRKLGDALGRLNEAPLFIDDTPSISMLEIAAKCRRLKDRHGLELVIVDYLQLMQSHRRVDNRQQEIAEISRGLKMLAKDLKVPVIALSQLSRQPESRTDKRPILADLRESGSIEQDADLVAFIYRDEVYDEQSPDKGIAELIVSKHRNGRIGTIRLAFLGHLTKFGNLRPARAGGSTAPPPMGPPPEGPM